MTSGFRSTLTWLAGSLVAVAIALAMLPTSLVDGQYLPVGHDSFYHARRILDALEQPGGFYEFDPKMHFPEGDWITWPWGYDYLMAQAVRLVASIAGSQDPMKVLVHLPPVFVVVLVALTLGVASALKLSESLKWLAVLCVALSPTTQLLFGVGAIDHHWAEQLFALGVLWCALRWLDRPESARWAAFLGVLLGSAVACHAGLSVLQLPILTGLAVLWLRGESPPVRSCVALAGALVTTTLLVSLPSAPFRMGWFELYYLSWFQLYVAACTGAFVVALAASSYRPRMLLALATAAVVMLVPVLPQLRFSGEFLSGELQAVQQIDEILPPFALAVRDGGLRSVALMDTLLIFVAPLTLMGCLLSLAREQRRAMAYFWIASIFGLLLALLQQRLLGLGAFALYLPWLVWAQRLGEIRPRSQAAATVAVGLALLVAYAPAIRYQLFGRHPPAMDEFFASARSLLPVLAEACRKEPGLVLADANDGHLIRFFTTCPVLANNFRLTARDTEKYVESERLLGMSADDALRERPETRYVLARLAVSRELQPARLDPSTGRSGFTLDRLRPLNQGLFGQLLIGPEALPANVEALAVLTLQTSAGERIPIQGIYSVAGRTPALASGEVR